MMSPQGESKYGTTQKNIQVCHRQIKKIQKIFQEILQLETYLQNLCSATNPPDSEVL